MIVLWQADEHLPAGILTLDAVGRGAYAGAGVLRAELHRRPAAAPCYSPLAAAAQIRRATSAPDATTSGSQSQTTLNSRGESTHLTIGPTRLGRSSIPP